MSISAFSSASSVAALIVAGSTTILPLAESDNRTWMPERTSEEGYALVLPMDMPEGKCDLSVGLFGTSASTERVIEIGLEEGLRDAEGYCRLTQVDVRPAMRHGRRSSTPRN